MRHNLILTGDINLLGVTDPTIPFARVRDQLRAADVVFANLECCFYEPDGERSPEDEGFYAPLKAAEALTIAGVHAVGNANNVDYGAPAIRSSLKRLDELGILHTGGRQHQGQADLLRGRELLLRNRTPGSHTSGLDRSDAARGRGRCRARARRLFLCPTQRPERNGSSPRSRRSLTSCVGSRRASRQRSKSRATKWWCGQSHTAGACHAMSQAG